ncbi:MAG: hypothetical protein ACW98F_14510 [Candidatus Hodarchaeales archaeon]|jgi:DNA/RNA-binding domain of Phe-tRNA-synthetase-like protein
MTNINEPTIELSPKLKSKYSTVCFGSLEVYDVQNRKEFDELEEKKRKLEKSIQQSQSHVQEDEIINSYNRYFNQWGKTYPIEYQIKTIRKGGNFPLVSVLVDSMFLAELHNRILTSGHDLDLFQGKLIFDVSEGGERYQKINGKEQILKEDDIILRDRIGILASLLYGPAKRTTIIPETKHALYFAWCPFGMTKELINEHLSQILQRLNEIYGSLSSRIIIHY